MQAFIAVDKMGIPKNIHTIQVLITHYTNTIKVE